MSEFLKIAATAIAVAVLAGAGASAQGQTTDGRAAAQSAATDPDPATEAAFAKKAGDPRFKAALVKGDAVTAKALLVRAGAKPSMTLLVPGAFNGSNGPVGILIAPNGCDSFHTVWVRDHWITVCNYQINGVYRWYGAL
jgi:hypothetical protein